MASAVALGVCKGQRAGRAGALHKRKVHIRANRLPESITCRMPSLPLPHGANPGP